MLIELESAFGDKIIQGEYISKTKLRNALNEILKVVDEQNFLSVFCEHYGYEEIQCENFVRVDYVIDLDTHLIIEPKYIET